MRYLFALLFAALSFNAVGQIQYDFPYNPDADNDAFVSSTDLLELLAIYGEAFSTDELYLSQDSTSLIVHVGDMSPFDCHVACEGLEGNWGVITTRELFKYRDQLSMDDLTSSVGAGSFDDLVTWMYVIDNSGDINPPAWQMQALSRNGVPTGWNGSGYNDIYPPFTTSISINSQNVYNNIPECWCATQQSPRVEWHRINEDDWEDNNDQLSDDGWRLHSSEGNKVFFWRWAD